MRKISLFLLVVSLFVLPAHADKLLFSLSDPVGDDNGAGSYIYPKNQVFKPGSFDLTSFEVYDGDQDVTFRIYFSNWFNSPPDLQIANDKNLNSMFKTSLFLQNIDIYIDKDHKLNSGLTSTIPGRNVRIDPGSAWEEAIFIAPQPYLARVETKRLAKEMADKIIIPSNYEIHWNYIECKMPKEQIGQPEQRWGYLVCVTGAEWESSAFSLASWMKYGPSYEEPDLNRIVDKYASEWEFGGGDDSGAAPNVIDIITASNESQSKLLSNYDPATKRRAAVPAVYPFNSTLEAGDEINAETGSGVATVIDVIANVVTIDAGKGSGLYVGRLGQVYDGSGTLAATIMVEEIKPHLSICTVVPLTQREEIAAGMKVKFK